MKVWLDDVRAMPADFDRHVTSAEEAIAVLAKGGVTLISLDHGPGDFILTKRAHLANQF